MIAVCSHSARFDITALTCWTVQFSPWQTSKLGGALTATGCTSQLIVGSVPADASEANSV